MDNINLICDLTHIQLSTAISTKHPAPITVIFKFKFAFLDMTRKYEGVTCYEASKREQNIRSFHQYKAQIKSFKVEINIIKKIISKFTFKFRKCSLFFNAV